MLGFKGEKYGNKWRKMFTKVSMMIYWMMQTWRPMDHTFSMK